MASLWQAIWLSLVTGILLLGCLPLSRPLLSLTGAFARDRGAGSSVLQYTLCRQSDAVAVDSAELFLQWATTNLGRDVHQLCRSLL
jgi:hypothetical protein